MMQQAEIHWSDNEKKVAEIALKKAYDQEVKALIEGVREKANLISLTEDVWQLHDFLSAKRHEIDGKYDDREPFLMYTLSRLVKDGLLALSDLAELEADKQAKISLLTRM
ncbi:hypothetical protein IQ260_05040 [Leptolyngbya cf. ectocarpi LEGE 11479]|uniref:Fluorescence recovery protein n=1 Tax=Leptolyngbya cf. ectocarpi LEGE 11479 TaxID=1828722 RepID=A0A928ZR06_LEPEC|nr:hypothetical protein [Leptolyngbya ectocarpi]MBE9066013.1 hypothetical protein [Leptolyngbya cf. ectocarpi LEGE 11479]